MRTALAVALGLLCTLPARAGDAPWGEFERGLRCRAAAPGRIEEDLPLAVTIEFDCYDLAQWCSRLRTTLATAFLTLELVHVETGRTLEVWPRDPTGGRPFSFEPWTDPGPIPDGVAIARVEATFPLATAVVTGAMTTAGLEPGAYEARVRYTYPGPKSRWPAPRDERSGGVFWQGTLFWRGTVVSGPFSLVVEKPTAGTRKIRVPRRLRLTENREVIFTREDTEEIEIPARNGHFVLAEFSRDGRLYRTAEFPPPGTAIDGWRRHPGEIDATYEIRIVQTPWPPSHGWRTGPRRGGSTFIEWRRQYELRGPAVGAVEPPEEPPLPEGAFLRLGSRRFRHPGNIIALACSPDGHLVATTSYESTGGRVRIWDTETGRLVRDITAHSYQLEFSPDGRQLATSGLGGHAEILDVRSGERVRAVPMVPYSEIARISTGGGPGGISCLRFSPDGTQIALGGRAARTSYGPGEGESRTVTRQLTLVDLETGQEIRHFAHERGVIDVAFSPDGALLASVDEKTVRLWDTRWGTLQIEAAPWNGPRRVTFTPDGTRLLVAAEDGLGVLDALDGKEIFFRGAVGHRCAVAVNRTGTLVAAGGWQKILLWNPRTWEPVGEFQAARGGISSIAFAGDLLVAPDGHVLRVWDPEWGNPVRGPGGHEAPVETVLFFPDGKTIASASPDATVRLWDATMGEVRAVLRDNHTTVHAMALSPDGKTLATADYLGVRLRDAATGEDRGRIRVPLNGRFLAFSPDGKTLAIGGERAGLVLWDLAARTVRRHEKAPLGHRGPLSDLVYSPDGSLVVAGPHDAVAFLLDAEGKRPGRSILPGRRADGWCRLAFSPDGASLLCVSKDAVVVDVATGEIRLTRTSPEPGRTGGVGAWSPDGRTFATALTAGVIDLWDAKTGRVVGTLEGHDGRVTSLAFSPDGKRLASGGADTTVLVWEISRK